MGSEPRKGYAIGIRGLLKGKRGKDHRQGIVMILLQAGILQRVKDGKAYTRSTPAKKARRINLGPTMSGVQVDRLRHCYYI